MLLFEDILSFQHFCRILFEFFYLFVATKELRMRFVCCLACECSHWFRKFVYLFEQNIRRFLWYTQNDLLCIEVRSPIKDRVPSKCTAVIGMETDMAK